MTMLEVLWAFLDSTFFQSVAVIISVYVAYRGVNSWQDQHVWTRNAELAEELIVAAREYRHMMNRIRSPASFGGEGESRERGENESDDKRKWLDHLFVPLERLSKEQDLLNRFQSADARGRVRFGKDVAAHLDSLLDAHRKFVTNARVRYMMERDAYGKGLSQEEIKQKHEREKIVWTVGEPDELDSQIGAAIEGVESSLAEYIGKKKR